MHKTHTKKPSTPPHPQFLNSLDKQQQKEACNKANRKKTRRRDETARKYTLSVRVSDQERRMLEAITTSTCRNVSELIREAIALWVSRNHDGLCQTR